MGACFTRSVCQRSNGSMVTEDPYEIIQDCEAVLQGSIFWGNCKRFQFATAEELIIANRELEDCIERLKVVAEESGNKDAAYDALYYGVMYNALLGNRDMAVSCAKRAVKIKTEEEIVFFIKYSKRIQPHFRRKMREYVFTVKHLNSVGQAG